MCKCQAEWSMKNNELHFEHIHYFFWFEGKCDGCGASLKIKCQVVDIEDM